MSIRRVPPDEAARLMAEGWTYVDVRTVAEFAAGHPAGAWNVPYLLEGPSGRTANPAFEPVMQAAFARDARLLLGCKTGNRSLSAAGVLAAGGFTQAVDVQGGVAGEVDVLGQIVCEGWIARGLPWETTTEPGRSWAELQEKK